MSVLESQNPRPARNKCDEMLFYPLCSFVMFRHKLFSYLQESLLYVEDDI